MYLDFHSELQPVMIRLFFEHLCVWGLIYCGNTVLLCAVIQFSTFFCFIASTEKNVHVYQGSPGRQNLQNTDIQLEIYFKKSAMGMLRLASPKSIRQAVQLTFSQELMLPSGVESSGQASGLETQAKFLCCSLKAEFLLSLFCDLG